MNVVYGPWVPITPRIVMRSPEQPGPRLDPTDRSPVMAIPEDTKLRNHLGLPIHSGNNAKMLANVSPPRSGAANEKCRTEDEKCRQILVPVLYSWSARGDWSTAAELAAKWDIFWKPAKGGRTALLIASSIHGAPGSSVLRDFIPSGAGLYLAAAMMKLL